MKNLVLIISLVLMLNCYCFGDTFTSHLKPNTDSTLDIGTSSLLWQYIYSDAFTDGTASWLSNSLSGFTSISGTTLTDGTFVVSGGIISAGTWQGDTIEHEFGGLEADISSYTDGLYGMASGVTLDIDTIAEIETAIGGSTNILIETEIDASSELLTLMDDETGTGALVFGTSPTFTTSASLSDGFRLGDSGEPNIVFDETGDDIGFMGCDIGIGTLTPTRVYGTDTFLEIEGASNPALVIHDTGQAQPYQLVADSSRLSIIFGATNLIVFQGAGSIDVIGDFTAGTIQADDGISGTLVMDDGTTERITLVFTGGVLTSRTVAASTALLIDWTD